MTAVEAMAVVDRMVQVVTKMRSVGRETLGDTAITQDLFEDLEPWVYGEKSILPKLAMLQDRGNVTGPELYNLMYVAHHLAPYIAASALGMGDPLPEPDLAWQRGWQ